LFGGLPDVGVAVDDHGAVPSAWGVGLAIGMLSAARGGKRLSKRLV
jgi:hypothetical protein